MIEISDYDPTWPQAFKCLRNKLLPVVGDIALAVEHVGSTAVPGLAAKPILDIGLVVPSRSDIPELIQRLTLAGYVHRGDLGIEGREAFDGPSEPMKHHLYAYAADNLALRNHILLRDYLRAHQSTAAAYGDLKKRLAREFAYDAKSYVEGKTNFILGILRTLDLNCDEISAIEHANRKYP
jgi:GrpB-like predicted nucleotidyltransferase (UPF0157 family)